MMKKLLGVQSILLAGTVLFLVTAIRAADSAAGSPFIANWALTLPTGGAGWLGVHEEDGKLKGDLLWGGGSVLPVHEIKLEGDTLTVMRNAKEGFTAQVHGDDLEAELLNKTKAKFTGKRTPPLPPTPDLSKVKFGEPISLFNGKDLTGWRLVDPKAENGWSVIDGVLNNNPYKEGGQGHKHFGNLRTDREFEDFNLTLEVNVAKDPGQGNSGVYLRGIYECQILDSYGKPLDSHNMAAIYSRITPTEAAEKPAGEWQTLDITLVDRHATVILNGKKIIDNKPLLGCTGGALWSDQFRPGPIMLQGDHSGANYRNILLRPVVK
jgi:hypothetical protein